MQKLHQLITHNTITLSGDKPNVEKFKETVKGENSTFDFNKIKPMPTDFDWDVQSVTTEDKGSSFIYGFNTAWDTPRPLVKPLVKLAHDLHLQLEWEATHDYGSRYASRETIFTEHSKGRDDVNRCWKCEAIFDQKGAGTIDQPTFKGYTIDLRLKQFRKTSIGGLPEFINFDSPEGEKLCWEMHKVASRIQQNILKTVIHENQAVRTYAIKPTHIVRIQGDKRKLNRFEDMVRGPYGVFDFTRIIPMPDTLYAMVVKAADAGRPEPSIDAWVVNTWTLNNWGCIGFAHRTKVKYTSTSVTYTFDTIEGVPEKVVDRAVLIAHLLGLEISWRVLNSEMYEEAAPK